LQPVEFAKALWAYLLARFDINTESEDGMTTTEIAVVTFLLVGAAIVVMGIIYNAAKNNANNIPEPSAPGP
jgi:hypothetical protein